MTTDKSRNVFINCPFDESYAPLLRATVFAIVDCGFVPRCALERSDASEIRILKIYQTISECPYGVHDISRVQLDQATELPRFNMPLELGIFLGAKFMGADAQRSKTCLVFDEHPHRYQKYLSDVSGQDISWHSNDPLTVVRHLRNWLATVSESDTPTTAYVWDHYQTFTAELQHQCANLRQRPDELTYTDILRHIARFKSGYSEYLTVGNESKKKPNPEEADIRKAVKQMERADLKKDAFIILAKGANGYTYMQAIRQGMNEWSLEYQHGHLEQHYASKAPVTADEVSKRLVDYAHAEARWHVGMDWNRIDVHE